MTPWFKKTKLHIVAAVTACGIIVIVMTPNSSQKNAADEAALEAANFSIENTIYSTFGTRTLDEEIGEGTEINGIYRLSNIMNDADTAELSGDDIAAAGDADEEAVEEEIAEEEAPRFYTVGVVHSSVAEIQQRLMDLGFMEYSEPTTLYGRITSESIMMFQRQNDLKQDGILGPETKEMLLSEDAKKYAAKLGMDGDDIKRIQTRLYEMGYLATADQVTGHFGDVTEAAVKKMQENNGLSADGKVGTITAELLYSGEAKANLIAFGEKSDLVLTAQNRLKELGYLTSTPDGTYGNDTLAAVKQFQSRNDLVVDGYLGPTTREVLYSSTAVSNGMVLGENGDSVKRIQELLAKYGYLTNGSVTGYFGDVTEAAVKAFQSRNGLVADGNVGALTMNKLTGDNVVKAESSNSGSSNSGSSNSGSSNSGSSNSGSSNSGSSNSGSSNSGSSNSGSSNSGSSNSGSSNSGSSNSGSSNSGSSNSGSSNSGSVSSSASALVSVAKSKVGAPYVWGSKGPSSFDCSGFVYWCLNQVGVKQSYLTSGGWANVGKYKRISKLSDVKAGDIVVVRGHVGIAAGGGMVIDASTSSGCVVYRDLSSWWSSNFIVAWRIFD